MSAPFISVDQEKIKRLETLKSQTKKPIDNSVYVVPDKPIGKGVTRKGEWPERGTLLTTLPARIQRIAESGAGLHHVDFERTIGTNDLLPINYLARGTLASKTVGRLYIKDSFGIENGWATGFLISPQLLMTNNHVIDSPEAASLISVEFGYELDANGNLPTSKRFQLRPDIAFITDDELDFTVVGVSEFSEDESTNISAYGFVRLNPKLHKIDEYDFVTIIQHPNGDYKQIAIRENKVLNFEDNWIWYASDTAPGSSGSPVFNDYWQVVGLHQGGVPESRLQDGEKQVKLVTGNWVAIEEAKDLPDHLIEWIANKGARVSRIFNKIKAMHEDDAKPSHTSIQEFLDDALGIRTFENTPSRGSIVNTEIGTATTNQSSFLERSRRSTHQRDHFRNRNGYNENFLQTVIPLPTLTDKALHYGNPAKLIGSEDNELKYRNFSVVLNGTRRLAFFTAVNIDGSTTTSVTRNDKWFYDARVPLDAQVGNELYKEEHNYFDRGHLVRRLDPVWGDHLQQANDDTFHWTNAAPQYFKFNQRQEWWQGLENYILHNTDQDDLKATVFTGPVFDEDDEEHRGILIPQRYWKVVAVEDEHGQLYSSAYMVSQETFATGIPFEALPVGEVRDFQLSVASLEQGTGLDFGEAVRNADVLSGQEPRRIRGLSDVEHPRH